MYNSIKPVSLIRTTSSLALCVALLMHNAYATPNAPSNTTIYGRMDMGYAIGNRGDYEGRQGNDSKMQMWNGASSASVWGIKGGEHISNSTRVYYHLEAKMNVENGLSNGFNRLSFIGVSAPWGNVQLGRQRNVINMTLTPFDLANDPGVTSPTGNTNIYPSGFSMNGAVSSRFNSMLAYESPRIADHLTLRVGSILKNDDIFKQGDQTKYTFELGAEYLYNQFSIAVAYRSKPHASSNHAWGIGIKYTFPTFEIAGGFINNHDQNDGKGYFIGATVPIHSFTLGAQLAHNTYKGADDKGPLAWTLFSHYRLSQRSKLYAQYGRINEDAKQTLNATRKYGLAVGITHNF